MALSTEDRAIADIEKAIKAADSASEKAEKAQDKADELATAANRANRVLKHAATHPDLPEDFDLDEFRRSLEAPFDDDTEDDTVPETGEVIPPERLAPAADDDVDDDDPFGDDE